MKWIEIPRREAEPDVYVSRHLDEAIPATLEIRRNSDGVIRRATHGEYDFWGPFIWEDGNFACDCNRADFFARAGGEPDDDDVPCSHDKFDVRLTDANGKVLYEDGDGWPTPRSGKG